MPCIQQQYENGVKVVRKKREKLRVIKITFIPKVFSASERAAWDKMWDMLLRKAPEQIREDDMRQDEMSKYNK